MPASDMLNLLRKDFSEDERPAGACAGNREELPSSKANTTVPSSNQLPKLVTAAPTFHNSGQLDPEAIAAFYERSVGMGPQQPPRAARSHLPAHFPVSEPVIQPMNAVHSIFRPAPAVWMPRADPQLRLASAAPAVEQFVNGVPQSTAARGNQGLQQCNVIPISPIVQCTEALQTSTAAPICSLQQPGPAPDARAELQTANSWPSVIMETPESFPSCDPATDVAAENGCNDVFAVQPNPLSTGSEFQGFEPGSEKLAPALDFLIRADSMRVLDTPATECGQRSITPDFYVPTVSRGVPCNHEAPTPPAVTTTFQKMGFTTTDHMFQVVGHHSYHPAVSSFGDHTAAAPAANQPGAQHIGGFSSGIHVAGAATTSVAYLVDPQVQAAPSVQPYASCEVTPGVAQGNTSLPSIILDTPMDCNAGQYTADQHTAGQQQQSVILDTPMDSHIDQCAPNAVSTGSTVAHMHAQQQDFGLAPFVSEDQANLSDPAQATVNRSPLKRRRRRSRAPVDPAFESASQEQRRSASPPSPSHMSLPPAQQMHSTAQPQSLPSSSRGDGSLAEFQVQQCGAAQVVTPRLCWDGSTATLNTVDVAQQHTRQFTGPEGQGPVRMQSSSKQSSLGDSAVQHTPSRQSGAALETPSIRGHQPTASVSSFMSSEDYCRRLDAYVQSVVADVMKRRYDF